MEETTILIYIYIKDLNRGNIKRNQLLSYLMNYSRRTLKEPAKKFEIANVRHSGNYEKKFKFDFLTQTPKILIFFEDFI